MNNNINNNKNIFLYSINNMYLYTLNDMYLWYPAPCIIDSAVIPKIFYNWGLNWRGYFRTDGFILDSPSILSRNWIKLKCAFPILGLSDSGWHKEQVKLQERLQKPPGLQSWCSGKQWKVYLLLYRTGLWPEPWGSEPGRLWRGVHDGWS